MSSQTIVKFCSPTLAGLKTGNLFQYKYTSISQLISAIREKNNLLNEKGVYLVVLKAYKGSALILIYRKKLLEKILSRTDIQEFLVQYGYENFDIQSCLNTLKKNLKYKDFPHEIGVFLDYPLDDIKGFIDNKGENFKCLGCWKVYANECEAQKTFKRFQKCTNIYCKKLSQGFDIGKLTVAG